MSEARAAESGAIVETGRAFMKSATSGRWAGERFLEAIQRNQDITPALLRVATTLRRDEWIQFDTQLVEAAQIRLRGWSTLIAAGLGRDIPNGLAKTILEYEKMTDMGPAVVSMDGVSRDENDTVEFSPEQLPLPITHKDWYLNLRRLMASRQREEPLDMTHTRLAGRKIAEKTEHMLFNGGPQFGGVVIYGLTTHPDRNIAAFGTGGAWTGSKTGEQILTDIGTMKAALEGDRFYGPYHIFTGADASTKMSEDFKAASDRAIRERMLAVDGITGITVCDQLASGNVVMVQMTSDVIEALTGEDLQTVQWDILGGFQINFKGFTIQVPLIKSDTDGRSGVVHMS